MRHTTSPLRPKVLDILASDDPLGAVNNESDEEKQRIIEESWKFLRTEPHSEHRIKLRQILSTLTESTEHLPKGFFIKNIQYDSRPLVSSMGGGGEVVYGKWRGRSVAIKRFEHRKEKRSKMIHSDAVAWATLRHQNVLSILGVTIMYPNDTRVPALVLPWINNNNIGYHIWYIEVEVKMRPPLSEWIGQIVSGLQYLHEEGIIHGSLRTTNVMVDDNNVVKLMDYQTEQYIDRSGRYSERAANNVPLRWCAPEQRPGGFIASASKEADIYSFACVWLHLHTHRVPFHEIEDNGTLMLKRREPDFELSWPQDGVKAPHSVGEFEATEVWKSVKRCLSKNPSDRPKADELQEIGKFDTYWIREAYDEPNSYGDWHRNRPSIRPKPTGPYWVALDHIRSPFTAAWGLARGFYQSLTKAISHPPLFSRHS